MRITMEHKFGVEDLKTRLMGLTKENRIKLIYEWVKTNHIDFKVFNKLMKETLGVE